MDHRLMTPRNVIKNDKEDLPWHALNFAETKIRFYRGIVRGLRRVFPQAIEEALNQAPEGLRGLLRKDME